MTLHQMKELEGIGAGCHFNPIGDMTKFEGEFILDWAEKEAPDWVTRKIVGLSKFMGVSFEGFEEETRVLLQ